MIEIKATTTEKNGEQGVQIESQVTGTGLEIVNETLLIIKALMDALKDNDPLLHLAALETIATNKDILSGSKDSNEEKVMSDLMSKGIIKEGRLS